MELDDLNSKLSFKFSLKLNLELNSELESEIGYKEVLGIIFLKFQILTTSKN